MKRTFIAIKIPLSEKTKGLINILKQRLKDERIKWVEDYNMHITLFFLGNTDENKIIDISNNLKNILKEISCFDISLKGIGVFKSVFNPRAIWIGIKESKKLEELNLIINKAMNSCGYEADFKEFKPHLTLGRSRFIRNKDEIKELMNIYKETVIQDIKVSEVCFYESQLTPKGPVYKIIETIPLC